MSICRYNGLEGTHIKVTEFVRDKDCLVCGPGTLVELDTSSTLSDKSISSTCATNMAFDSIHKAITLKDLAIQIQNLTITLNDVPGKFIKMLEEHPKLRMSKASVTHEGNNLYMQSPEVLEQMTRPNLSIPMFELLKEVPYTTVHATGMAENNGKKVSSLRKLRVAFKGIEDASKMDTTVSS
ncbi:NEDD8-activating enzyme E1 catalytic subunit [Zea mays]|uniref:NEDD8-activating enzyme E1 catalytic subunit n=1 Tax=Zea mays TaxID=4577 RepID=A0A1D6FBA5_MAIZE|nr:NEDD8-activating enzyme E1 catalytic subunit [Zea mays]